jgi:hypothetical protein
MHIFLGRSFPYRFQLLGVGGYSFGWHNMSEVLYFLLKVLVFVLDGDLGGLPEIAATLSTPPGMCGQSGSRRPGTRDMTRKRGLLWWSPLTTSMSLEHCRGRRIWLWAVIALDPSRMQFSPCEYVQLLANNCSGVSEWSNIWLKPGFPECQSTAVEQSYLVTYRSVSCSSRRSRITSTSGWRWWGMTRGCPSLW